ncbi:MAG: hypothetical protein QG647_510 [Patescibacteria group bacterium]|nr:hypothetical protein [Patescibacteria group bacterium]
MSGNIIRIAGTAFTIGATLTACGNADDQKPLGFVDGIVTIEDKDAVLRSGIVAADPNSDNIGNIIDKASLPGEILGFDNPYIFEGVPKLGNVACSYNLFTADDPDDLICVPTRDTSLRSEVVNPSQISQFDKKVKPVTAIRWYPNINGVL